MSMYCMQGADMSIGMHIYMAMTPAPSTNGHHSETFLISKNIDSHVVASEYHFMSRSRFTLVAETEFRVNHRSLLTI